MIRRLAARRINAKTIAAMKETRRGGLKRFETPAEMFAYLDLEDRIDDLEKRLQKLEKWQRGLEDGAKELLAKDR